MHVKVKCQYAGCSDGALTQGKVYDAKPSLLHPEDMWLLVDDKGTPGEWFGWRFVVVWDSRTEEGK